MKIVFLHIRKSAGTSFRFLVDENYGEDKIFWEHDANKLIAVIGNRNLQVFGGHVTKSDFELSPDESIVFCAIIRHPIERIISLYNHHNSKSLWAGVEPGFSAHSLYDTIKNCEKFRGMCNQDQCYTVSGSRSFAETISKLNEDQIIIGCIDYVDVLIDKLSSMFGWVVNSITKSNRACGNFKEKISVDNKTLRIITDLVSEDIKLYKFVNQQKVFISPLLQALRLRDEHRIFMQTVSLNSRNRAMVELQLMTNKISCAPEDRIAIPIIIENKSLCTLPREGRGCVKVGYHLFNNDKELLLLDGLRTYLPEDILPEEKISATVIVKAPTQHGTYYIKVGLIHDEIAWFDDDNDKHEKELEIEVIDSLTDINFRHSFNNMAPQKLPDFSDVVQLGRQTYGGMEIQLKSGWYDQEDGPIPSRWTDGNATILINSSVGQKRTISITLSSFRKSRRCQVLLNREEIFQKTITTDILNVTIPISLQAGDNELQICSIDGADSPSNCVELSSPDQRKLAFNVSGIEVVW